MKITGLELDNETILILIEQKLQGWASGVPSNHQTRMYLLSLSREKLHRLEVLDLLSLFPETNEDEIKI
jgi:hypothetical protein